MNVSAVFTCSRPGDFAVAIPTEWGRETAKRCRGRHAPTHRTFALHAFLLAFAMQLYLLTAPLTPDSIAAYDGDGDYFLKRRAWFFGLIASVQVFDAIDTLIKGANHASQYPWTTWAQDGGTFVLALAAMAIADRRFQLSFAILNLAVEVWFIATNFTTLG